MNALRNKVQLIGNLGKDPEIKNLTDGKIKASFSLATTEIFKNKDGEKKEDTQWHNIVVWGKKADVVESYLHKGSEIALQGKLINRSYEKDGDKKYVTEINLNELLMMDKKQD